MAILGAHPFSTLVGLAVLGLGLRLLLDRWRGAEPRDLGPWGPFFGGVLLTNGLVHFLHGASGEAFPAPFGYLVGPGFPSAAMNVLWGSLNLAIAASLLLRSGLETRELRPWATFLAGILAMGLALAYVFS